MIRKPSDGSSGMNKGGSEKEYRVGPGRPPKEFQFKPGQSGNPKGRPKGARNRLGTQFLEALEADFNRFGPQAIILMRERKPDILYPCCRRSLAKGGEHQPRS